MVEFKLMMTNLPEPVSENDIIDMFSFADKDKDGKISWEEFLVIFLCFSFLDCLVVGDDHPGAGAGHLHQTRYGGEEEELCKQPARLCQGRDTDQHRRR